METSFKLSRREKTDLILRYLRRCLGLFSVALVCACLSMVLNAVTPQIIKITVDSILGTEPAALPKALQGVLSLDILQSDPIRALWMAVSLAWYRGVFSLL